LKKEEAEEKAGIPCGLLHMKKNEIPPGYYFRWKDFHSKILMKAKIERDKLSKAKKPKK
jgi:hypothetical protein